MTKKKQTLAEPVLSPEEQAARHRQNLIDCVDRAIRWAQDSIDAFAATLANQPAYAFEWSQDAFQAAADLELLRRVKQHLDENITPEALAAWGKDSADSCIRDHLSGRSTSPAVNEINRCRAVAFIKWAWVYQL